MAGPSAKGIRYSCKCRQGERRRHISPLQKQTGPIQTSHFFSHLVHITYICCFIFLGSSAGGVENEARCTLHVKTQQASCTVAQALRREEEPVVSGY